MLASLPGLLWGIGSLVVLDKNEEMGRRETRDQETRRGREQEIAAA
jgi:hypothetical protein